MTFDFEKYCDLETWISSHSRPFDWLHSTSYAHFTVTSHITDVKSPYKPLKPVIPLFHRFLAFIIFTPLFTEYGSTVPHGRLHWPKVSFISSVSKSFNHIWQTRMQRWDTAEIRLKSINISE